MRHWLKHTLQTLTTASLPPLQKAGLFGVLILFTFTAFSTNFGSYISTHFEQMLSAVLPGIVVDLTNEQREEYDLQTLTRSPLLDKAAHLKAEHMRDNDYFAHFSPDGISPWYWFDEAGYTYIHAGENLAVFFDESDDVVQAWMDSPLHRDNILKNEYTEIGLATVATEHEGYDTVFIVQLFGTPASSQPPAISAVAQNEQVDETPPVPVSDEPEVLSMESIQEPVTVPQENPTTPTFVSEENIPIEKETVVEKMPIEDKTVFVANHESTTTHPTTLGLTGEGGTNEQKSSSQYPRPKAPKNTLTILYVLTALISIVLIVQSITHATKHAHFAHAVYGIALLFVTTLAIFLHTYVVYATVF